MIIPRHCTKRRMRVSVEKLLVYAIMMVKMTDSPYMQKTPYVIGIILSRKNRRKS